MSTVGDVRGETFMKGPVTPASPEERQRATFYVAGKAQDAQDARLLLSALGLWGDA